MLKKDILGVAYTWPWHSDIDLQINLGKVDSIYANYWKKFCPKWKKDNLVLVKYT